VGGRGRSKYPVQFEESVRWIYDQFLRMVGLPLGVYAISAMP